jgi:hypothetical protein
MSKASLAHHYDDPRDTVTAPHRFMALTHYYVDRWLPELGERGHIIVTVLRRMGYLDRDRDIERGGIEIEQEELAELCGLKLRTMQREFACDEEGQAVNPALHRFVQREKQYHRNSSGRIVREKTVYVVQMKDPLHPSDQQVFEKECDRREKGGRSRQVGGNDVARSRQLGGEERQSDTRSRQSDTPTRQLGGNYKVNLDSELPLETLKTPAVRPECSLALFPEKAPDKLPVGTKVPPQWNDLTETERFPFVTIAERELKAIYPERATNLNRRLVEVRAKNLFEQEAKRC